MKVISLFSEQGVCRTANFPKVHSHSRVSTAFEKSLLVTGLVTMDGNTSPSFYAYPGTEDLYQWYGSRGYGIDYLFAGGLRIASLSAASGSFATVRYYQDDQLGSTRLVTSSTRSVIFADGYQPFGQDNGNPTGSETYKFTGKPVSQTTGLYYDYPHWSDSSIGGLISQDPLAGVSGPGSLNP